MTPAAPLIADLFLSLAALSGLAILHALIAARGRWEPLNRRFLFVLRAVMLLFIGRALIVLTGAGIFRLLILLGAALIPLAVLLLAEGLLRRHAPLWAKLYVGAGTLLFGLSAFWFSDSIDPIRLWGLLIFQTSGFLIAALLVLTRDKSSLSTAENRVVERLALSLFLLIPMAAADFLIRVLDLPVQVSPLAVLFLCWLVVSLGRGQSQHRAPLFSFVAILLATLAAGGFIVLMAGMGRDAAILTISVILAAVLVAVLFIESQALKAEERSQSLLRHMAEDRSPDGVSFLRRLQAHPLVEGAALIEGDALADLDAAVLSRIFAASPVLRRTDPPFAGGAEGDHIDHLFNRYEASHILLADVAPMVLVALSMPSISASPRAEMELAAVQRMALLMTGGRG